MNLILLAASYTFGLVGALIQLRWLLEGDTEPEIRYTTWLIVSLMWPLFAPWLIFGALSVDNCSKHN